MQTYRIWVTIPKQESWVKLRTVDQSLNSLHLGCPCIFAVHFVGLHSWRPGIFAFHFRWQKTVNLHGAMRPDATRHNTTGPDLTHFASFSLPCIFSTAFLFFSFEFLVDKNWENLEKIKNIAEQPQDMSFLVRCLRFFDSCHTFLLCIFGG